MPHAQTESLPRFLHKLQEKKQTKAPQQQASHAVSLYYELMRFRDSHSDVPALTTDDPPEQARDGSSHRPDSLPSTTGTSPKASSARKAPDRLSPKTVASSNAANASPGVSWVAVYTRLANDIQVRHYSPKTLKAYTQWVRHFQTFTRSQDPASLSSVDVREFLTSLAVDRKVSAATQNQAFNALLFFYRHVLNKEFGKVEGVVRAKCKPCVPVVFMISGRFRSYWDTAMSERR